MFDCLAHMLKKSWPGERLSALSDTQMLCEVRGKTAFLLHLYLILQREIQILHGPAGRVGSFLAYGGSLGLIKTQFLSNGGQSHACHFPLMSPTVYYSSV